MARNLVRTRGTLPETLGDLVGTSGPWDLILVPEGAGAPVASTAASLAGVRGLVPAISAREDGLHADLLPVRWDPAEVILGLAQLLRLGGWVPAATALLDAWSCVLEERLHPPGLPILALEGRPRAPDAFVGEVVDRLGSLPRVLQPVEPRGAAVGPPRLRLV